ncbi:hypothetical protein MHBO_002777 [Bonamia ostreae]|uniref:Uncharacterized protein n=1 Tax=Bonamia ostreae TaxID=126728 RepID=A0ABV2ANH7_9EUKA
MAGNSWILVAAIDFGTTYSGYAFSFKDKPMDLQSPQTWYAGTTQLASLKTPTCLLLNADQTFQSFGYEAQNKYATLAGDDAHHDVYFFERFKMFLHHSKVN